MRCARSRDRSGRGARSPALAPLLAALAVLTLAIACAPAGPGGEGVEEVPTGRSVVLISIDTLRSDRLPAYGYDRVETPAIDALRTDGVLFERAYSPVPLTLPAHASLFTGLLPPDTGVRDNAGYRLEAGVGTTLAQSLGGAGYSTGGAVSAWVMRRETGVGRGFDHWEDAIEAGPRRLMGDLQRSGAETLEAILPWLDSVGERPLLFFFHIYEPHVPRDPPEPFASRYVDPYDGEVASADAVMAELFAALRERGLYDPSTIVLLSDHGEGLGDHGEDEHGILIYRESIQVPLLVKLPDGRFAGASVAEPVHLVDVAPTLYALAGVEPPEGLPGISLLSLLGEGEPPAGLAERHLYSETFHPRLSYGWSGLTSVIRGRHHYIEGVDRELYDLIDDPGEQSNLVREDRRTYAAMRDALDRFDAELDQPFEESSEARQSLAALGYLGSTPAAGDGAPVDPKTKVRDVAVLKQGIAEVMDQRAETAIETLERATRLLPDSVDAWQFLGLARQTEGRSEAALEAYQRAFELSNGAPHLAKPMARLAFRLQRWEDAAAYAALVIESSEDALDYCLLRTRALLFTGDLDPAFETIRRAVEEAPADARTHYLLGAVHMGRQQVGPAETELRRALELDPDHRGALSDLTVLLMSQGRRAEARPLVERLRALGPEAERPTAGAVSERDGLRDRRP